MDPLGCVRRTGTKKPSNTDSKNFTDGLLSYRTSRPNMYTYLVNNKNRSWTFSPSVSSGKPARARNNQRQPLHALFSLLFVERGAYYNLSCTASKVSSTHPYAPACFFLCRECRRPPSSIYPCGLFSSHTLYPQPPHHTAPHHPLVASNEDRSVENVVRPEFFLFFFFFVFFSFVFSLFFFCVLFFPATRWVRRARGFAAPPGVRDRCCGVRHGRGVDGGRVRGVRGHGQRRDVRVRALPRVGWLILTVFLRSLLAVWF